MTSLLLTVFEAGHRPLDLGNSATHVEGYVPLNVKSTNRHRDQLPVSRLGERGQADADDAVILGNLGDEVRIGIRASLIENHDGLLDRSALSDNRHVKPRSFDWRSHRLVIDAMNRKAEEKRKCL